MLILNTRVNNLSDNEWQYAAGERDREKGKIAKSTRNKSFFQTLFVSTLMKLNSIYNEFLAVAGVPTTGIRRLFII